MKAKEHKAIEDKLIEEPRYNYFNNIKILPKLGLC